MTERTDNTGEVVLYDGDCPHCTRWARRLQPTLARRGIAVAPLPEPGPEMLLRRPDGSVLGGADAVVHLARRLWWAWPVVLLSRLPGGMATLRAGYRWIAAHRHCRFGGRRGTAGLPVVFLIATGVLLPAACPPWACMWVMAGMLFLGCKWATWRRAHIAAGPWRTLGYFLAWPGMDPRELTTGERGDRGAPRTGTRAAFGKIAAGAALFWGLARVLPADWALARGWTGMIGFVLVLHFGVFDLLASAWGATPIMHAPLRSRSVTEFWSRRWNAAFPQLAKPLLFEPARRRWGARAAVLAVFLVSGLVHELVVSLPAGGGYGGPTLYFLIQGLAAGWDNPPHRNWLTWPVIVGPVGLLFHRPFVERVVLPMMQAWGAL